MSAVGFTFRISRSASSSGSGMRVLRFSLCGIKFSMHRFRDRFLHDRMLQRKFTSFHSVRDVGICPKELVPYPSDVLNHFLIKHSQIRIVWIGTWR